MPRWPIGLHRQTGTQYASGARSHRIPVLPIGAFSGRITGVPIGGGQGQATVSAQGGATIQLGPQGLGTTWYPASVTVATTTGVLDTSSCDVYVGPGTVLLGTSLAGTIFPAGRGTLALAVPSMPVGWFLTAVLSGGKSGDTFTVNVIGFAEALAAG